MLLIQTIILILLLMLSAFFSGIETALMSINSIKVKALVEKKVPGAKALQAIKDQNHKLIITILIGNNLVNILAASLATVIFTNIFGMSGVGIATGIMTFCILLFGEITPKTIASNNAEQISLKIAKFVKGLMLLFTPFIVVFEWLSKHVISLFGSSSESQVSEEELKTIVTMGRDEGILSHEAAEMMHNLLEFEGTKVTEIMTPKTDILMINAGEKLADVMDFVIKKPYSRYPVYEKNKDNIVGILDIEDVLKYAKDQKLDKKVKSVATDVYFIPESKEIDDLLSEFEEQKSRIAIIVDEYGGVSGLVTVEDILEEIVGEIFDKSKKQSDYIKKINDKITLVDGRTPIDEINKNLNLNIKESDHYNTVAGYVEHKLQKIPQKGEFIKFKKYILIVHKVTQQGIKTLEVKKI